MLTISACKTADYVLPPEPIRQEFSTPESVRELAEQNAYHYELLLEWEFWAESVKEILGIEE